MNWTRTEWRHPYNFKRVQEAYSWSAPHKHHNVLHKSLKSPGRSAGDGFGRACHHTCAPTKGCLSLPEFLRLPPRFPPRAQAWAAQAHLLQAAPCMPRHAYKTPQGNAHAAKQMNNAMRASMKYAETPVHKQHPVC
eukprot:1159621-Pelagomonas_calceolata.AAC.7